MIWVQPPKPIVKKLCAIVQVNDSHTRDGENLMYSLAKLTCSRFRERPIASHMTNEVVLPVNTHTSLCMFEYIMIYTQSEFVYHHHSMCLKMFGLEYLVEYISTTVGQRAPPISTTYLIFKKNGVLICHVIYMILGFIYIWIWISRVVYRQRLITFYCLSCSNTPCQISQAALWTLQQYFSFCLFVFMCVVHVCVCSRCQRTALSVFLQEFCQFNFKIFFSHWPVNCSMVSLSV